MKSRGGRRAGDEKKVTQIDSRDFHFISKTVQSTEDDFYGELRNAFAFCCLLRERHLKIHFLTFTSLSLTSFFSWFRELDEGALYGLLIRPCRTG